MYAHCFSDKAPPELSPWRRILLVSACLVGWQAWAPAETITTNKPVFFIPFVTKAEGAGQRPPAAVRLYVSGDQGDTWHFYQRQLPDAGRFSFRAGVDGEFWFAVQTVAAGEDPPQPAQLEPEMRVIVDTRPPRMTLSTTLTPDGQIEAAWEITPDDADPSTFRLERSTAAAGPWQIVDMPDRTLHPSHAAVHGRATWSAGDFETHFVRATVRDRVGNQSVVERQFSPRVGHLAPSLNAGTLNGFSTNATGPIGTAKRPPAGRPTTGQRETEWTPTTAPEAPVPHQDGTQGWYSTDRNDIQRLPMPDDAERLVSNSPVAPHRYPTTGQNPFPHFVPTRDADVSEPTQPATSGMSAPAVSGPPDSHQVRWSNSRRFELDYEIDSGALNVHRVEVWYTRDRGRSWQHHGDDSDRRSPYLINVGEDGLFGFRLMIQSREGFAVQPPRSGDAPDAWVHVDATAPSGRITAARYGLGTELGTLRIEWEAEDAALADRPIGLFFADNPDGPWRRIADQLPHTGHYAWKVDDRVPRTIYLRLEVRDRAGNVHDSILGDPISNEGLAPRGRIRDIRPADRRGIFSPVPATR